MSDTFLSKAQKEHMEKNHSYLARKMYEKTRNINALKERADPRRTKTALDEESYYHN